MGSGIYLCAETILQLSNDSVFIYDQNGIIELVNSVALETFDLSQDEIIGKNITTFVGESSLPVFCESRQAAKKNLIIEKKTINVNRKENKHCSFLLSVADVKVKSAYGIKKHRYCAVAKEISPQDANSNSAAKSSDNGNRNGVAKDKHSRNQEGIIDDIMEASTSATLLINDQGIINKVNGSAILQFGWSRMELVGKSINMILSDNSIVDFSLIDNNAAIASERLVKSLETKVRKSDGSEVSAEFYIAELKSIIEQRTFCVKVKDLTNRKDREMKMLHSERLTKSILDASFDALFNINEKGVIQMVNEAAVRSFGWTRNELIGSNISIIVGKEHADTHDQYIARYLQTGEKRVMGKTRELPARRKDGSQFFIELGLTEVLTEEGQERMFCGFVRDITKRKQDELEIMRKQRLTMGMINASFDALFNINEKGIIQMVNDAAVKNFGWTRDEFVGSNINIIVGKEHAAKHDGYIARYLKTGEKRAMGKTRELPARRKDGSQFFIELGLTEVLSEEDEERMFCGFVRDITKRKEDELEIVRKQRLTSGILDASFDALFNINEKGVIQMVNETAVRSFGWSREELIGSNISIIVGKEHAANHDQYIARYLQTGEKRVMGKTRELPAKRKDGSQFTIELGLTEVVTEIGEDRMFCGFVRDITKRKQDELEIIRKQRLTTSILDASFDALFNINENGIIQMVNETAVRTFGWTRDELIGSNINIIVGKEHAANHDGYIARYLKTGEKRVMGKTRELSARRKDGSEFFIELSLTEVLSEKGEERMFCDFVRDITKKKQDELELMRKQRLTNGIIDASFDALFNINEKGVIQMVNEAAVRNFGWTKEELVGSNISIIVGMEHAANHDGYIARYLQTGEKRVMGKTRELPARRKDGSQFLIELGLSEIVTEKAEERMFCGFVRDVTKRKQDEHEIMRKQRLTMGIIDASFDALLHINEKGIIQMVNEAAVKNFGWTREEFIGSNINIIVGKEHADKHDGYIARYLKTGEKRVMGKTRELPARRKDGSEFFIELSLTEVVTDIGEERMFCGFVKDITKRKQDEQEIMRKQRLMMGIIDASFDALFNINEKGIIQMVNEAAVRNFGWTREELIGSNINIIVGKEHASKHDGYIARYLKTGEKRVMGMTRELPARRKDGSEFFIELSLSEVVTDIGEERMFCGFVKDITKKKQDEQEIMRKQRLTSGIIDASFDALFNINEKGIIQMVNEAAVNNFGWTRDELIGSNINIIVGKEHAANHDGYIARYLKTGEKRVMGKTRELPARRKDGSEFFIELGLTEILTENGEERLFCGFVRDITKRKQDEQEIMLKQRLTMGIIDASFDALFNINDKGIIQMVNEAAVRNFGWTREELIGSNINIIVGKEHASKHDGYIARYLKTGEKRVMGKTRELPARRKDGSEFLIELGLTEVLTEEGQERMFCGFVRDITKRKQDEFEIMRKQRLTSGIIDASFDALFNINAKGIIQMVNEAAVNSFGWTREEFIGNNISMIVGIEHAAKHDGYIARYLRTGEKRVMGKTRELPARRKDGTQFLIELGLTEVLTEKGEERMFCGFVRDITKRKQDEHEIMRKQRLTMGIFDASFDALFNINEKGIIQMVNEAAVTKFGWTREEFIGSNISMIVGKEHAPKHDGYIARYLKTGEKRVMGKTRELPARKKDGSEFLIELSLAEIVTDVDEERMFCGFVKDITQRKKNEQEILQRERLNQGILEAAFDALLTINEKGIIQTVNEAATKQLGWSREELIGQNIKIIVGGGHAKNHDKYLAHYLKTGEKRVIGKKRELLARRKDGTEFPIELGLTEVEIQEGEQRVFCGFLRDLTQEKMYLKTKIEKASAEALLLNMLPENIAQRLKDDPSHIADHFAATTILFADIVGFTELSGKLSPINLVQMLNDLFSRFDSLLDKYHLNKVKTIGDCYMVTSIPQSKDQEDSCSAVCYFSLDMMKELQHFNLDNPGYDLNLRVGINTGPVVAGIVGTKRFLYDLWGDAVNIASRMESTGVPGRIQVTKAVVAHAKHEFVFEFRGMIMVKGKGEMETHFLTRAKDTLSRRNLLEKLESCTAIVRN